MSSIEEVENAIVSQIYKRLEALPFDLLLHLLVNYISMDEIHHLRCLNTLFYGLLHSDAFYSSKSQSLAYAHTPSPAYFDQMHVTIPYTIALTQQQHKYNSKKEKRFFSYPRLRVSGPYILEAVYHKIGMSCCFCSKSILSFRWFASEVNSSLSLSTHWLITSVSSYALFSTLEHF